MFLDNVKSHVVFTLCTVVYVDVLGQREESDVLPVGGGVCVAVQLHEHRGGGVEGQTTRHAGTPHKQVQVRPHSAVGQVRCILSYLLFLF